nr:hypothetical protein CFP56_07405 [Quercus suber]
MAHILPKCQGLFQSWCIGLPQRTGQVFATSRAEPLKTQKARLEQWSKLPMNDPAHGSYRCAQDIRHRDHGIHNEQMKFLRAPAPV